MAFDSGWVMNLTLLHSYLRLTGGVASIIIAGSPGISGMVTPAGLNLGAEQMSLSSGSAEVKLPREYCLGSSVTGMAGSCSSAAATASPMAADSMPSLGMPPVGSDR